MCPKSLKNLIKTLLRVIKTTFDAQNHIFWPNKFSLSISYLAIFNGGAFKNDKKWHFFSHPNNHSKTPSDHLNWSKNIKKWTKEWKMGHKMQLSWLSKLPDRHKNTIKYKENSQKWSENDFSQNCPKPLENTSKQSQMIQNCQKMVHLTFLDCFWAKKE